MEGSENQQQEQQQQPLQENQQPQPIYLGIWYEQPVGSQLWYYQMYPEWQQYFAGYLAAIDEMKNFNSKKWSDSEFDAYMKCLEDVQQYIEYVIYTGQCITYEDYVKVFLNYGQVTNSTGYKLYLKQIQFLNKREGGQDIIPKKPKREPQENQRRFQEDKLVQQKQVIRKDDPVQNIEQFKTRTWPEGKYVTKEFLWTENANLIFIGHVDSGKSTLTGNLLKELKQVDEQELARNKQDAKESNMESWQLAYIADTDPNERVRGKTIECSKLMFTLESRRFTLFDAPGHKNYVPNMMMGACQADIAVLIISAKDGQFESGFQKEGQTKQHAMLARALGVQGFLVVVTKMNTINWSEKRYNQIREAVTPFLENSCGFKNVNFIPIDSIMNKNIHSRFEESWFKGPCLVELLNGIQIPPRTTDKPLRIPVVDKFREAGMLYIYGKLESGMLQEGQTVTLLPRREYITVKEIYNARDERMPFVLAGENVKLRIKGLEQDQINRGDMLCNNMNYCQESQEFKADLTVLQLPDKKKLISSGYECILHMHAIAQSAEISKVEARIDGQTKKALAATFLKPGEVGKVHIRLQKPICLQKVDYMPSLGRFTLRDEGKTIGFGEVRQIKPAKKLTSEQKDQLGIKEDVKQLNEETKKMKLQK